VCASRPVPVYSSTMVEIHKIEFVDSCPVLPSTAPRNCPHIIDLGSHRITEGDFVTDIQIQDAVVTVLNAVSSDTLLDFLASTGTFRIEFEPKVEPRGARVIFVKKGNHVLVSHDPSKTLEIYITNKFCSDRSVYH